MTDWKATTVSIVVVHDPEIDHLFKLTRILLRQSNAVVIVLNSAPSERLELDLMSLSSQQTYCVNNANRNGLAGGLNIGIKYALGVLNANYVYLSDQDSTPSETLITSLLGERVKLSKIYPDTIGAIGPLHPLVQDQSRSGSAPVKVPYIITSGSLIAKETLETVGLMDEALFIDYIDTEWCYRATSMGFSHWLDTSESMQHTLGNSTVSFLGKSKPLHSDANRHYYIMRNSIYLWRQSHMTIKWKLTDMAKFLRRLIAYPMLADNYLVHAKAVLSGVKDGLLGRMGERSMTRNLK